MYDPMQDPAAAPDATRGRTRKLAVAAAVGAAGMVAGGVLAATLSASAASGDATAATPGYGRPPGAQGQGQGQLDPSKSVRSDEKLLTGTTKAKVLAAVEKKYPDATVQRVETDSEGVYEAHIVDGGQMLTVQVGKDFTITGTQTGGPGGPGGHGGPGDHDGDGPQGQTQAPPSSSTEG